MDVEINPLEAKKLRTAMKAVADNGDAAEDGDLVFGDEVMICAPLQSDPRAPKQLVIKKGGKAVAAIYVTPGTLKKLRFEMEWWKRVHTGGMKAFRHNNRP